MNERFDLVGEVLVLMGHGQGHLQPQFEREHLIDAVDGADGDGSLEVVGVTHGVSPYWYYGGSIVRFLIDRARESHYSLSCAEFFLFRDRSSPAAAFLW